MFPYSGLTAQEVLDRKNQGKVNNYKQPTSRSYYSIFRENVFNFINTVLFAIGILLVLINKYSDSFIYVAIIILNSLVGTIQEIRAKIKLDKIALITKPKSAVIREGEYVHINVSEIVVDDVIFLQAGDLIPVDGVVLQGLTQIDESLLTGESDLINKNPGNQLFSGTFVASGSCVFRVTKVGSKTTANTITDSAKKYSQNFTPLQKEVNLVIRILIILIAFLAILITFSNQLSRTPLNQSLPITAVIVGIVPNSLFVMINLAYALGGILLLKKGALVQQLNAIESLSHVNVLCVDKTGTLTTNKIILKEVHPIDCYANDAETALANFAATVTSSTNTSEAITQKISGKKLDIIDEVSFSSAHKWSGFSYKFGSKIGVFVFGAPEIILEKKSLEQLEFGQKIKDFQNQGLRVLLLTHSDTVSKFSNYSDKPNLPTNLKPVALAIFENQLRMDVKETLAKFRELGIKIKVISGDNPDTVLSIAKQAGLELENDKTISGSEIESMNALEIQEVVESTDIFGRITPNQKESLINALKLKGYYVAMIGDGVNDVLSLKKANLGISMESGSQVTRSIADMLLLKDSFSSLPKGLMEGQRIRSAIKNIFTIYLTRVLYLLFIILIISILSLPFPFTIKQSSLISLLTTAIPALGITFWATYGSPNQDKMTIKSLKLAFPASVIIGVYSMLLYFTYSYFTYSYYLINGGNETFKHFLNQTSSQIQNILTIFLIICGLMYSVFISSPNSILSDGEKPTGDWKNFWLSSVVMTSFTLLLFSPSFRDFWDLNMIDYKGFIIAFGASLICLISIKLAWYYRVLERIFGVY